ncbi:MAG: hypothetical protein ACOX8H_10480 [Ruminococcus sp.]|jgi:hypothetical protein
MKHREKGVYGNSTMVFHTPSTAALENLFYLNYVGFFHCNSNYKIKRKMNEMYEPYLFILVLQGTIQLDIRGSILRQDRLPAYFLTVGRNMRIMPLILLFFSMLILEEI